MKVINYKKKVLKIIQKNYISFILGMLVILIPLIIFSVSKITIPFFVNTFKNKNTKTSPKKTSSSVMSYTVKQGEDLWSISEKFYGSGDYALQIASYNKLVEPYTLIPDQKLFIPTVQPTITIKTGEILEEAASTQRQEGTIEVYTVKEGEYLFQIAQKFYGDGNFMNKIIVANNLPYPFNLEVGQKLLIPR